MNEKPVKPVKPVKPGSEVDVPLLEYNLSLSHEERLAQHDGALGLFFELQNAGQTFREKEHEKRSQQAPSHTVGE